MGALAQWFLKENRVKRLWVRIPALDEHFFAYIVVCLKRPKINYKEAWTNFFEKEALMSLIKQKRFFLRG